MKHLCSLILFGCGVLAVGANAQSWQQDPYYRDDPHYRRGYSQQGYGYGYGYGYGRNQQVLVDRVMSDLDQAARRARLDGHEVGHFNEVARSLQEFQSKWARGKFDTGKLSRQSRNVLFPAK